MDGYDVPQIAGRETWKKNIRILMCKKECNTYTCKGWRNTSGTDGRMSIWLIWESFSNGKIVALQITKGELVLVSLKDHHSKWKLSQVEKLIRSQDGISKGAKVRVSTDGNLKAYIKVILHARLLQTFFFCFAFLESHIFISDQIFNTRININRIAFLNSLSWKFQG